MDIGYIMAYVPIFFMFLLDDYIAFLALIFIVIPLLDIFFYIPVVPHRLGWFENTLLWLWFPCMVYALKTHTDTLSGCICTGVLFGQGINVAHEMIHKRSLISRSMGQSILAFLGYGHWYVYHLHMHHRFVGRIEDVSTAPRHMSVYRFVPRSLFGSISLAYGIDPNTCSTLLGMTIFFLFVSWTGGILMQHIVCSAIGILFLEMINYIEHYGVVRKADETVREDHSWDYDGGLCNYMLFRLPCHADHHIHATRPFTELEPKKNALQLPFSYPWMIILSLFPGLYDSTVFADMEVLEMDKDE